MTLLSREGFTSRFFFSSSTSHCSIVPLPSPSVCHCSRICGLSSSFKSRMTFSATRSLVRMSTCVAMKLGMAMLGKAMADNGSGLMSMTTLAAASYCLGSSRLTATVVATTSANTSNATHLRARRIDRNCPKVIEGLSVWAAEVGLT